MPVDKHVIDTNVLLVASAAHVASPFAPDATPVEEAALRQTVLDLADRVRGERQTDGPGLALGYRGRIPEELDGATSLLIKTTASRSSCRNFQQGKLSDLRLNWDAPDSASIDHIRRSLR